LSFDGQEKGAHLIRKAPCNNIGYSTEVEKCNQFNGLTVSLSAGNVMPGIDHEQNASAQVITRQQTVSFTLLK